MARETAATNEQALDAFLAAKAEIDRLLAELTSLSSDHFHTSPDEITWPTSEAQTTSGIACRR